MRDNVFDVPIGLLWDWVSCSLERYADNGRLMFVGVCCSEELYETLACDDRDSLVGGYVAVESYGDFGCGRFGRVCAVGPVGRDWFPRLCDALDYVEYHEDADLDGLRRGITCMGFEFEVWHIVADAVEVTAPAAGPVPGSSRAASASTVLGALAGEHDGVFEVPITQFVTWRHEHERGMLSDVLTDCSAAYGDWVYRSRGVSIIGVSGPVCVGDWFRVTTCAAFGSPALDVWALRVTEEKLRDLMARDRMSADLAYGVGAEYEWWHIVDDPRPLWPVAIVWMPSSDVWVHGCEWVRIVPRADFCGCLSDDAVYRVDDRVGVWNELMVALMDIDESVCHNVYEDEIAAICDGLSKCDNARTSDGGTFPFWIVCYDELEALGIDLVFGFALDDAGKFIVPPEYARARFDDHYWDERPEPQPADTWYEIDLFGPEVV